MKHRMTGRRTGGAGRLVRTVGVTLAVLLAFGALGFAAMASGLVGTGHRASGSQRPHPSPALPGNAGGVPATSLPPERNPSWVPAPHATKPPRQAPLEPLREGMRGPQVRDLQERLDGLGYTIATVDGTFGYDTLHAVLAFQKVQGLGRDGVVGPATRRALRHPVGPSPRSTDAGFHVEVDLARQVLLFVRGGEVSDVFDVSTGSGQAYVSHGETAIAHTPTGSFRIERKIDGWRESDLGLLYRPAYFVGGYAIHGSSSVPPYPASHGCVRVTNHVMDMIYDTLALGTPVLVHA
jgi:L,D-transpeptidase catalytic domain/Putative peptidoglycan binding domain